MLQDLATIHGELGYPTFVWVKDGNTYPCIASLSQFNRDLGEGGFRTQLLLTMTVPRYDTAGDYTFPNDVIPQPQQKVTFQGKSFRIENVREDTVLDYDSSGTPTSSGARIRIIATDITKGV